METNSGAARAIVTVHGTWAGDRGKDEPRWWEKNSEFGENLNGENPHNTDPANIHEFIWSGENSFLHREAATNALIDFLEPLSKDCNQIDILAHFHGGNIVANALFANRKNSNEALKHVRNVVSVGTPFFGRRTPFLRRFAKIFIFIGEAYALLFGLLLTYFGVAMAFSDFELFSIPTLFGVIFSTIGLLVLYVLYRLNRRGSRFRILFSNKPINPSIDWYVINHDDDEAINALRIAEQTHYELIKKDTIKRLLMALFNNGFVLSLAAVMAFEIYALITSLGETSSSNLTDELAFNLPWKLLLLPFGIYLIGLVLVWIFGKIFSGSLSNFANNRISGGIRAVCFGQDGPTNLRDVQEMPHRSKSKRLEINPDVAQKMSADVEVLRAEYFDNNRDQLSKLVVGQSLADLLKGLPIDGLDKAILHTTYFDHDEVVKMIAKAIYQPGEIQAP